MRSALFLCCVLVPVPVWANSWYLGVGGGPGARLEGDLDRSLDTRGEIAGRVVAGRRAGALALEAVFFGTDAEGADGSYSTFSLGLEGKLFAPLWRIEHGARPVRQVDVELFARGGVNHTWLAPCCGDEAGVQPKISGPGIAYGAGIQVTGRLLGYLTAAGRRLPTVELQLWIDVGQQRLRLDREIKPIRGVLTMATIGFGVGLDF